MHSSVSYNSDVAATSADLSLKTFSNCALTSEFMKQKKTAMMDPWKEIETAEMTSRTLRRTG